MERRRRGSSMGYQVEQERLALSGLQHYHTAVQFETGLPKFGSAFQA